MITMPAASKADMEAAAVLLGYHPTHLLGTGSMFCDMCATNVTGPMGMDQCPNALPPAGTVIPGRIRPEADPGGRNPRASAPTTRRDGVRVWRINGSNGVVWDVEERIATRGPDKGRPYMFCPCPAWRFGHQRCKHTDLASQEK